MTATSGSRKIAVVGCGAVTQQLYAKELARVPNVTVRFVHDLNPDLARLVAGSFDAAVATPEEIRERADAVIIATPPATHKDLITYYAERVPVIVCEKPFVGRRKDAVDLVNLARKKKVGLYVAHFRRCLPQLVLAREMIATGSFGRVRELYAYEGGRFSWATESGYVSKDPFGGVLFDTGSHTLDMALFAAGFDTGPLNVKATRVRRDRPEPSHDLRADISFSTPRGNGTGRICLSRRQSLSNRIKIVLDNASLEFAVGLSDRIRLTSRHGSSIVYAGVRYQTLMDCFALQYHSIFNTDAKSVFEAARFVNLSGMLETIGRTGAAK